MIVGFYGKIQHLDKIVGKRISGVIFKEARNRDSEDRKVTDGPRTQIFLIFDDDSSYEFYSYFPINPTSGVRDNDFGLEDVRQYCSDSMETIFEAYMDEHGEIHKGK